MPPPARPFGRPGDDVGRSCARPGARGAPAPARPADGDHDGHDGQARVAGPARDDGQARVAGQASVEFVVVLPVVLLVLAIAFQALLAVSAAWEVRVAARAAARAHAFGADARDAARGHLRSSLERSLVVTARDEGDVHVSVRIPAVIPSLDLGRASARSHFRPQG